ncbi:ABC transporter ATP-binding protein [Methanocella sp. MCL-LM]|uniref:ABC transporter ATP-binding protein n=1 Tax=Methanocella sp. MCL-LM TaxID=3412035 RepID=UPI003C77086C
MKGKDIPNDQDTVITVRNLSKEFIIPHERRTTLFEGITGVFRPNTYEKFTALDDVSFDVKRGESIGIIGDNGSGKSTLLKIVAGILRPTRGTIAVNGRITPFLELGVGFQPDLSARENIEIYSTIMGLPEHEIQKNIDSVLDFAGLTNFRDAKLKNFSSGMQVRLAFSTAIQVKPEILVVDEVLAVGDMEFQQKCLDIFNDYLMSGVTILFVSHDLSSVRRFCRKTLLLNNGRMVAFGDTCDIIDRYIYRVDKREVAVETPTAGSRTTPEQDLCSDEATLATTRSGNQKITITDVTFIDKFGKTGVRYNTGDPLVIRLDYTAIEPIYDPVFGIAIYDESGKLCYGTNTDIQGLSLGLVKGRGTLELVFQSIDLLSGSFKVTVAAHSRDNVNYDWLDKAFTFAIINTGRVAGDYDLKGRWK